MSCCRGFRGLVEGSLKFLYLNMRNSPDERTRDARLVEYREKENIYNKTKDFFQRKRRMDVLPRKKYRVRTKWSWEFIFSAYTRREKIQ